MWRAIAMGSGRRRGPWVGRSKLQAAPGAVADFADLLVGSGVVVAGADEPAAVVVVYGDLVGVADEPSEDVTGFTELAAKVGWHAGWRGGAFRRRGGLSGDLVADWWAASSWL